MFRETIHTQIDISAGVEQVWRVLTDLDAYPEWNPMIRQASGSVKTGQRLTVRFEPEGRRGHTFRPRLLVVDENKELRWLGSPGLALVFESQHLFLMEQTAEDKCRLHHDMIFYGLLIPLLRPKLQKAVIRPFDDMNRALKKRAEQGII